MVLCFRKSAVAVNVPEDKPRRKYSFECIRSSLMSIRQELEELEWQVGGRYKVQRPATIFTTKDLRVSSGLFEIKDEVLLLSLATKDSKQIAQVLHKGPTVEESQCPGWIALDDAGEEKPTLLRKRLEGSWDIGGRYRVNHPATVRAKASLSSDIVSEVPPEEEVILAALSVDKDEDGRFRLRAFVSSTSSGLTGWISPETLTGNKLLDPVNLLGKEIVEIHRKRLTSGSTTISSKSLRSASTRSSLLSTDQGSLCESGPQQSWTVGEQAPWQVGGKYRVLEKLVMRESPELTSSAMGSVPAGALVTIMNIHHAECAYLGFCPCALVTMSGPGQHGTEGWVRCAAKDGHDLIDTRDQLEAEKILQKVKTSQQGDLSGPSCSGASETAKDDTPEKVPEPSQARQTSRRAPKTCCSWYPDLWLRVLAAAASFCTK